MQRTFLLLCISLALVCKAQLPAYQQLGLTPISVNHCTSVKDQHLSGTCWSFPVYLFWKVN